MTQTWLKDDNGNRCSVEYFGSREAAQAALDSLKNCTNCTNCRDCKNCSDCSDCSGCSRCSDCSGCSNVAWLVDKQNLKGDPDSAAPAGAPPVPVIENIHQRVYAAVQAEGAFDMAHWHKQTACGTTHCRGGMVVHLAGEAGYALARFHNDLLAAQLIYKASGYPISPCRFYDSNEEAMADMKRLAEGGAA